MKNLPLELVGRVIETITSISDLLSLRSVNSTCNHLVTPHALRKLHVQNSVQSAQHCRKILDSPSLSSHVREVVYDQRDHERFRLLPSDAQYDCDRLEMVQAELEDALTEAFCALSGFKNLESVVLNFWPSFHTPNGAEVHEQPFWFTDRQVTVLHAAHYAMNSSSIRSLTLNNVVLTSPAHYDFVSSVTNSPLHHLSLSVVSNSELGGWSGSKALNGSLGSLLPLPNTNLKSLVLRSNDGLYHSLKPGLGSSTYPALETLIVENIVFDHTPSADGIEEFIIHHKASLRRLELRGCSTYVPCTSAPPRRWCTIWRRFEEELTSLTQIMVGDVLQGYVLLDGTHGYIPHLSLPATLADFAEEDKRAYLHFSDRVNRRSTHHEQWR